MAVSADLLRRACERAGLEVMDSHCGRGFMAALGDDGLWLREHCEALPAYVASRLVAMVRELGHEVCTMDGLPIVNMTHVIIRTKKDWITIAEEVGYDAYEQRIRAALEVLDDGR